MAVGILGCASEGSGEREAAPGEVSQALGVLAERLDLGAEVTREQLDGALAPLRIEVVATWSQAQVMEVISAVLRVRAALVKRFRIDDALCTADTWERYSLCDGGLPCLVHAHVGEVRCLWFFSH
jgi:hypothetical protein